MPYYEHEDDMNKILALTTKGVNVEKEEKKSERVVLKDVHIDGERATPDMIKNFFDDRAVFKDNVDQERHERNARRFFSDYGRENHPRLTTDQLRNHEAKTGTKIVLVMPKGKSEGRELSFPDKSAFKFDHKLLPSGTGPCTPEELFNLSLRESNDETKDVFNINTPQAFYDHIKKIIHVKPEHRAVTLASSVLHHRLFMVQKETPEINKLRDEIHAKMLDMLFSTFMPEFKQNSHQIYKPALNFNDRKQPGKFQLEGSKDSIRLALQDGVDNNRDYRNEHGVRQPMPYIGRESKINMWIPLKHGGEARFVIRGKWENVENELGFQHLKIRDLDTGELYHCNHWESWS